MYTVEIESEARPGTWFQVDDEHPTFPEAISKATDLAASYDVGNHLRVARMGFPILGV